ncbi:hypothetical protein SAMN02745176_03468 [Lutispora thermophila DSM 19022]|uniref:Uncharacterized protein n=2 Tax=Lutispora TaxID=667112 RepID=A0A1M6J195_9FIRM|nr:hypothetical protein SAMN02745176_03468 [Lutispora thermophila DSM 19022]
MIYLEGRECGNKIDDEIGPIFTQYIVMLASTMDIIFTKVGEKLKEKATMILKQIAKCININD